VNIAYVHTGLFPSNSPSLTFTVFNAVGLAQVFDNCHFFVKKNSSLPEDQVMKTRLGLIQPDNLKISAIPRPALIDSNYFFYRQVYRRIQSLARSDGLDAVISRNVTFLPYLARIRNELRIPVYHETHDFFADLSLRTDINTKKKRRQEQLERTYIPRITGLICLQNTQKKLYVKIFPNAEIHVARTGIHTVHDRPDVKREYITYIGSFDRHKGITTLLKALQLTGSGYPLLLVGGKNEREISELREEIQKHYDLSKVAITGWINKSTLKSYLDKTAVGIIPLRDTFFNRYLTSPLKLFDFYSHGIPVIASDLPTLRELVQRDRTGRFFKPDDASDLARQIDHLFAHPDVLEKMTRHTLNAASEYLWEKRARQILDIVKQHQASNSG
jgi:glycosyltransferase involved in cell wall biosynthesis